MQWLMAQIRENGRLYTKTFRLILILWEERMLHLPHFILNNPQLSSLMVLRAISVWSVTSFQPNICTKKTWYVYRNTVEPWLTEQLLFLFLYRIKISIPSFLYHHINAGEENTVPLVSQLCSAFWSKSWGLRVPQHLMWSKFFHPPLSYFFCSLD